MVSSTDAALSTRERHPGPAAPRIDPPPRALLLVILSCQLMLVLDGTVVNVALHDIKRDLHFSTSGLSWVINAYSLAFGGLLLLGARLGDLLGRRRVFLAGMTLFVLASLAGGLARTGAELVIARGLQGAGGALASPSALAVLMTVFAHGPERNRAAGLYTAVSGAGGAVGLIAGGMLAQWLSWRWVLFVNVPPGIAVVVLAAGVLTETERQRGRVDLLGAVTSTLGMGAVVFGLVHASSDGWTSDVTLAAFGAGSALLAAFLAVERRVRVPIVPLWLFADRERVAAYLARALLIAALGGTFFILAQFVHVALGFSDVATGLVFLPMTAAMVASSQACSRRLVEVHGVRRMMIGGAVLALVGALGLTRLSGSSGVWALVLPLVLLGAGQGLAAVPLTTASLHGVGPADAGAASGLVNVMQQVGGAFGLAVTVAVFTAASHSSGAGAASSHAFVAGSHGAFWTVAVLLAAMLFVVASAGAPARGRSGTSPS